MNCECITDLTNLPIKKCIICEQIHRDTCDLTNTIIVISLNETESRRLICAYCLINIPAEITIDQESLNEYLEYKINSQ